jgi:hypothetical protein
MWVWRRVTGNAGGPDLAPGGRSSTGSGGRCCARADGVVRAGVGRARNRASTAASTSWWPGAGRMTSAMDRRSARVRPAGCAAWRSGSAGSAGACSPTDAAPHRPRPRPSDHRRARRALRDDCQAEHEDALRQDRRPGLGERPDRPVQGTETGHGRRDKRTNRVLDAPRRPRVPPGCAARVFLLERYTTRTVRKRPKGAAAGTRR